MSPYVPKKKKLSGLTLILILTLLSVEGAEGVRLIFFYVTAGPKTVEIKEVNR